MEKALLIAGKDLPEGGELASGASLQGRITLITSASQDGDSGNGYRAVFWNRASALSARTVVLSCINAASHLDEVALVFDGAQYAAKFGKTSSSEIEVAMDEMILGYQFLVHELIVRFSQRKDLSPDLHFAKIAFLYKPNLTLADSILASNKGMMGAPSYPAASAAGAAFKAFAENTAAMLAENDQIVPVLVHCDPSNDLTRRDSALASWLCTYFDALDEAKKRPTAKQLVSWVKAGAKKPGGKLGGLL